MSQRLACLASLIQGKTMADIGCDHAKLAMMAIRNGCEHAYACDIAPGPLKRAQAAIRQAGLEKQITTLLTDGLQQVPMVDTVVIAGMGGATIQHILELDHPCGYYVLSAHSEQAKLRHWLNEHGFRICFERFVFEQHPYFILVVEKGQQSLDEISIEWGYHVQSEQYLPYLKDELAKIEALLAQLETQPHALVKKRASLLAAIERKNGQR